MAVDGDALTDEVATRLGVSTSPAGHAVAAALTYIGYDTGLTVDELLEKEDDLLRQGIVLLAMRIYQDTPNLGGETNQLDPTFAGIYTPARLYSHLDQYWSRWTTNFGVA